MSQHPSDPVGRLEAILEHENDALRRGDVRTVAACSAEKLNAVEDIAKWREAVKESERLENLRALAAENQRLLVRALEVQERIIGIVAAAGVKARAAPRYGANGNLAADGAMAPFAMSAQA